ncbi:MAG: DUF3857 and transglutaminase domain-containing protein [Cyclobacteriaceae bacterium]|nr:DUF3857 and transglutaminase domain-containing protein [Cyclobacteriaceae bacterium]
MKYPILLCIMLLSAELLAQEYSQQFGTIAPTEWEMTAYARDTKAEAVAIYDIGESIFIDYDEGYQIRFTRSRKIKILNKSGVKHAEVTIPFYVSEYGSAEKVVSIEAFTYNQENGRYYKKPLDAQTVYEEMISNRWRVKKFAFPDVKEGSILEYRYVVETPFHFNLPDWDFQSSIPTIFSQYTVRMIPFYEYVFITQGITRFDTYKSSVAKEKRSFGMGTGSYAINHHGSGVEFNDMIHTFAMNHVPAFRDEGFITTPNDYIMKVDFQLAKVIQPTGMKKEIISTWPVMIDEMLRSDNFGKYLKSCEKPALKSLETLPDLNAKTASEKSKVIIEWVRSRYIWNGMYSKYTTISVKDFESRKTGNAAEINLYLAAMLNAAGIDAKPVIISTRDHGKIAADYPFDHFFNYVIVLVTIDGKSFLSDGTEPLIAYNRLPIRCINDKGLIVDKAGVNWVNIITPAMSIDHKIIQATLDPNNQSAVVDLAIQSTEYESFGYKSMFKNDSLAMKKYLINHGFQEVNKVRTLNYANPNQAYILNFAGKQPVEQIGNKLVFKPFLDFPPKENPLKEEKRNYPVDMVYANTQSFKSSVHIPAGYRVTAIPESYSFDTELASLHVDYSASETLVEANASYSFKKSVFTPAEYEKIKSYYNLIVNYLNEDLIFEKVK